MDRLIEVEIDTLKKAKKLLKCLKYKTQSYEDEDDVTFYKENEISKEILALYTFKSKILIIYPTTYFYSQSQVSDEKKLEWERKTIESRVRKCLWRIGWIAQIKEKLF